MKKLIAVLSLALAGQLSLFAAAQVGKPAPDFTAKDIEGKTHSLSDFKGKIVVLESYNLDCPFVLNHYKTGAMQALQQEVTGKGGVWLVVNSTHETHPNYRSPEAAKKEFKEQKMKATAWLHDSDADIGRKYAMRTTPHMYVINEEGVLVYQGAIDDRASASGDPKQARNYVREAIGKLRQGEQVTVATTKPYGCTVKYAN
jgi:peroxiredoxin